jgi:DNA-binding transcriptional regulator LsrR (DeoR family)
MGREEEFDRLPGRPRRLSQNEVSMAVDLYYNEGMPVREVADAMRVSHMTVWRAIARVGANGVLDRISLDNR